MATNLQVTAGEAGPGSYGNREHIVAGPSHTTGGIAVGGVGTFSLFAFTTPTGNAAKVLRIRSARFSCSAGVVFATSATVDVQVAGASILSGGAASINAVLAAGGSVALAADQNLDIATTNLVTMVLAGVDAGGLGRIVDPRVTLEVEHIESASIA